MRLSLFLTLLALPGIKSSDNSDYQRRCEENERKMQEHYLEMGRRERERERERQMEEARMQYERKQDLDEYTERYREYKREKEALEKERNN